MISDLNDIDVLFVAGFSPITLDTDLSTVLYKDTLRLPLKIWKAITMIC